MEKVEATLGTQRTDLFASFDSRGPTLDSDFGAVVIVAGVKDVRIDDQSVVDRSTRIANVPLGDGLEFVNNELNVKGGRPQRVEVSVGPNGRGTLTPEELELLLRNEQSALMYNSVLYYPATADNGLLVYNAVKTDVPNNQIIVDTISGDFTLANHIAPAVQTHIEDNVRHITAQERSTWNDKVSVTVAPDPDSRVVGEDFILVFATS